MLVLGMAKIHRTNATKRVGGLEFQANFSYKAFLEKDGVVLNRSINSMTSSHSDTPNIWDSYDQLKVPNTSMASSQGLVVHDWQLS